MQSFGWTLIQEEWCPNLDTDMSRGKTMWTQESMTIYKPWREASEEVDIVNILIQSPELKENKVLYFKAVSLCTL